MATATLPGNIHENENSNGNEMYDAVDQSHDADAGVASLAMAIADDAPSDVHGQDPLDLDPDGSHLDEQAMKRQRLDDNDQPHHNDDDAAVLALAADGPMGSVESYGPPEYVFPLLPYSAV
jgi:hypothetical protein